MCKKTLIMSVCAILMAASQAVAARCSGYAEARIVWCDDFDSYCTDYVDTWTGYPPLPADKCADTAIPIPKWASEPPYLYEPDRWPLDYFPEIKQKYMTQWLANEPARAQNKPFNLYFHRGEADILTSGPYIYYANRTTHNFVNAIQAKDPTKNAVNGTNDDPLIIDIFVDYGPLGRAPNSVYYTELTMGTDRAPTNYVIKDCSPEAGAFPVICQQDRGREPSLNAICPPLDDTIHASIGFGTLAFLDPDPCNLETGRKPTRYHIVFFDGLKWSELRANWYPGNGGDFNWDGETNTTVNLNHFLVTITTDEFTIEHTNSAGVLSTATIPRQYTGPFDTISSGTGIGCELDPLTGEPVGPEQPFGWWLDSKPGSETWDGWWEAWADTPVVLDGELQMADGACCHEDGTCTVGSMAACDLAGGLFRGYGTTCETDTCLGACCNGFQCTDTLITECAGAYQGIGTSCATTQCPCPDPFADTDGDNDVDQDDFGLFQACVTGHGGGVPAGCECFNQHTGIDDPDIDEDDFAAFQNCASGPEVPLDVLCDGP